MDSLGFTKPSRIKTLKFQIKFLISRNFAKMSQGKTVGEFFFLSDTEEKVEDERGVFFEKGEPMPRFFLSLPTTALHSLGGGVERKKKKIGKAVFNFWLSPSSSLFSSSGVCPDGGGGNRVGCEEEKNPVWFLSCVFTCGEADRS